MTMQMPRDPLSKAYPAAQCINILTAEGAGNVVNRSHSTLRDWADPNRETACPNQLQEQALDKACLAANGTAPFADWHRRVRLYERHEDPGTFMTKILQMGSAFGGLLKVAEEIDGLDNLNAHQREQLHAVYGEMRRASTNLESCITQMQMRSPFEDE